MDISIIDKNSIKIRGKNASLVVNPPSLGPKISADAVVLLSKNQVFETKKIADYRIIINGPGSFEINGAKISGFAKDGGLSYRLVVDDIEIFLGRASDTSKLEGETISCQIAIFNVDNGIKESFVANIEPKIAILYGEKSEEGLKIAGFEKAEKTSKFTVSKDKLPSEMKVIRLVD